MATYKRSIEGQSERAEETEGGGSNKETMPHIQRKIEKVGNRIEEIRQKSRSIF